MRRRLDAEMVRRGLSVSREQAQAAIVSGRVLVSGAVAAKASRQVDSGEPVEVVGPPPRFVGRGGEKLDAALERFAIDVTGAACLDAGASTGGFTDCLLQRGAASVVAVDVGHGQLHERLRADPRVENLERTNLRHLTPEALDGRRFGVVVADLSFISLRTVAPALVGLTADGGHLVALIKPQFEATRAEVAKGAGVVRDRLVWGSAVRSALDALHDAGAAMMGLMVSPLRGADGNVEFLAWCQRDATPDTTRALDAAGRFERDLVVDAVVATAAEATA